MLPRFPRRPRVLAPACLLLCIALAGGCGPGAEESAASREPAEVDPHTRDSTAVAALLASEKWTEPSCRWLERGGVVNEYAQERALYRAARDAGLIRLEDFNERDPVRSFRVELTEAGRREAATCPPSSNPRTWGVPVSRREFLSAKYVGSSPTSPDRKTYEVEYRWVPTRVGARVRHDLTSHMTVQDGTFRTRVYMRNSPEIIDPSKWFVDQIDDLDPVRIR